MIRNSKAGGPEQTLPPPGSHRSARNCGWLRSCHGWDRICLQWLREVLEDLDPVQGHAQSSRCRGPVHLRESGMVWNCRPMIEHPSVVLERSFAMVEHPPAVVENWFRFDSFQFWFYFLLARFSLVWLFVIGAAFAILWAILGCDGNPVTVTSAEITEAKDSNLSLASYTKRN